MPKKNQPGSPCNCGCSGTGGCSCWTRCGACQLPKSDITISWQNLILGPGSTAGVWDGSGWIFECVDQLLFGFVCAENQVEFRVYYFVSGSCPSGQSQYCSTIQSEPFGLKVSDYQCSNGSFSLTCNVTSSGCPNLASNGYTSFTISGSSGNVTKQPCYKLSFSVLSECGHVALPGAIVTWDGPGGSGSCTTDSNGACQGFVSAPGMYTITCTGPYGRFQSQTATIKVPQGSLCGAGFTLGPSDGYACMSCCNPYPVSKTLNSSWSPAPSQAGESCGGTAALIWSGGTWSGCLCTADAPPFLCTYPISLSSGCIISDALGNTAGFASLSQPPAFMAVTQPIPNNFLPNPDPPPFFLTMVGTITE